MYEGTVDYISSGEEEAPLPPEVPQVPGELPPGSSSAETRDYEKDHPSSAVIPLPEVPGYEILEELGRGGMGIVYKARHLKLKRLVALKMVLPSSALSPDRLARFLSEAHVVARFQHLNLVQIYDIGTHEGLPYLSLELVEGGSLKQKLKSMPQPPFEAAALTETLARTVEYAHQKAVVHRDLKPANVLLTADGTPKVADFGLAKQLDQVAGPMEDWDIVGTPSYMSPEQARGESGAAGPLVDIYALGVILYEMLTGRPPFQAATKTQTLALVRTQEPVLPRRLVPQVPRDLELICLKCLKKDRHQRFASAQELAEELRRFQEKRPIKTRPAPLWERAWMWARRQPAAALLIAVSAAALLTLVLYLDQRARAAQRELDNQAAIAERNQEEMQRLNRLRDKVQEGLRQAQEAAGQGMLVDAQAKLQGAHELIQTEPSLTDLKPPLDALRATVAHLKTEQQARESDQQEKQAAAGAYTKFFKYRDSALFHGMVFIGVDLPVSVAAAKSACKDALAIYGMDPRPTASPAGPVFGKHVTVEQRKQCTEACYELLLVWAEAVVQPEPGDRKPTKAQLAEALRLLDWAAGLKLPPSGAYHLRRAQYLELLGEAEAARRERQIAAPSNRTALDYFLSGVSQQKLGQQMQGPQKQEKLKEAADSFEAALRKQPEHFWANYFLGVCHLQLQLPKTARANFNACLASQPGFLWLYLLRGLANSQLNEFRAAEEDYRQVEQVLSSQRDPDQQARYGLLVYQGALCLRQAGLVEGLVPLPWPLQPPNLVPAVAVAAGICRREKLDAAAGYLNAAVGLQPEQYPAHLYLSLVSQQQMRFDDAGRQVDRAIETARQREPWVKAQLYGQRARLHRDQRSFAAALEDLDRSLDEFPSADDHIERGRLRHARQRYKEALDDYDAALELRPTDPEAWRWKAEVYLSQRNDREAGAALDQYLAKGGRPLAEVYRSRGQVRARLLQLPGALADYSQALALQPDSATYAARGWVFLGNEVVPLALQDFEEAIRLSADNSEAYAGRGLIRARQGQTIQAAGDAEAALLQARAKTPRLLWNIAHIYAQIAGHLDAEPGARVGRMQALRERGRNVSLALKHLQDALDRLPAEERAGFWRKYVAKDALLNPLRGTPGFEELERKYK